MNIRIKAFRERQNRPETGEWHAESQEQKGVEGFRQRRGFDQSELNCQRRRFWECDAANATVSSWRLTCGCGGISGNWKKSRVVIVKVRVRGRRWNSALQRIWAFSSVFDFNWTSPLFSIHVVHLIYPLCFFFFFSFCSSLKEWNEIQCIRIGFWIIYISDRYLTFQVSFLPPPNLFCSLRRPIFTCTRGISRLGVFLLDQKKRLGVFRPKKPNPWEAFSFQVLVNTPHILLIHPTLIRFWTIKHYYTHNLSHAFQKLKFLEYKMYISEKQNLYSRNSNF